jgi:hypothetical protein
MDWPSRRNRFKFDRIHRSNWFHWNYGPDRSYGLNRCNRFNRHNRSNRFWANWSNWKCGTYWTYWFNRTHRFVCYRSNWAGWYRYNRGNWSYRCNRDYRT